MNRESIYKPVILILLIIIVLLAFKLFKKPAKFIPPEIPKVTREIKGKIAIVIDDLGYTLNNLSIIDGLKYPLTFSILPNLKFSKDLPEKLKRRGFEIILHLPMEPQEKVNLENNTILTSMEEKEIRDIVDNGLNSISDAKGVSNHMGSMLTTDPRAMAIIFSELKKRKLYFLDSFVTPDSVGEKLADKMRIDYLRRDVFLDNNQDAGYIKQQIERLKILAGKKGYAIGIGHDRRVTLEILKEVMPELKKDGYKLVFVSELVK